MNELKELNKQRRAILRMVYVTYKKKIQRGTYVGLCEVFRRCILEYTGEPSENYTALLDYYFPTLSETMAILSNKEVGTGYLWPINDTFHRKVVIEEMFYTYGLI